MCPTRARRRSSPTFWPASCRWASPARRWSCRWPSRAACARWQFERQRSEAFPDLPTIAESGFPGFEADQWYGITGPAGIDPAIAGRLNAEINKALASADVKARLEKEGGAAVIAPPEALGRHIAAEIDRWRPVVKAANIRLE